MHFELAAAGSQTNLTSQEHTIKMAAIRALSNYRIRLARGPGGALRVTVNQLSKPGSCARYTGRELSISCPVQANEVNKDCGTSSSEIKRALDAAKSAKDNLPTIFSKIINKEVSANIVYEDDVALAFEDVNPQAPCHVLVIPKKHIAMLSDVEEQDKDVCCSTL